MLRLTRVAIRVDASDRIGSGHVVRCLALADALSLSGAECHFYCREIPDYLVRRIAESGHFMTRLAADGEHSGFSCQSDAKSFMAAIDGQVEWTVLDHYDLGVEWELAVRGSTNFLAVIDDLANRAHACDLLVDHNAGRKASDYDAYVGPDTQRLIGPQFALLGAGFARMRDSGPLRGGPVAVKRLLVSLGGSDPSAISAKVLRVLADPAFTSELEITLVAPASLADSQDIRAALNLLPGCNFIHDVSDMPNLLACSDLVIGAGGVSALERCVLGVPTICITMASNQEPGVTALALAGALWYAGPCSSGEWEASLKTALRHAFLDPNALAHQSRAALNVCDGRGAKRVSVFLLGREISLRKAVASDAEQVFNWRNAPTTRVQMLNSAPIAFDVHVDWFTSSLLRADRCMFIAERAGCPIGFIRFDRLEGCSDISVFMEPALAGAGLGRTIIRTACRAVRKETGFEQVPIVARVKCQNMASLGAFRAAGFEPQLTWLEWLDNNA